MPYTEAKVRTNITVGPTGVEHDLGLADRWEGAGASAESNLYQSALGPVNLGGTKTREQGTARYLGREAVWARFRELDDNAGRWKVRVTRTPHDDDGTEFPVGQFTMTGTLDGVSAPNTDYSSNNAGEIVLTFGLDGLLA